MTDQILRATAAAGSIRLVAVTTTELVNEAKRRHGLSYLTSCLLGRAMGSGLLLASSMKLNQARVSIKFQSDGPLGGLYIDAGRDGTVRGYVGNPKLELDLVETNTGKPYFDFRSATGKGYLHVTRDNGKGTPFTSTVELIHGCVGEDIASYLQHSEQTQSAVFVGEKIEGNEIICSGALIAQLLPKGVEDINVVKLLMSQCNSVSNFSEKLHENKDTPDELFKSLFPKLDITISTSSNSQQKATFKCRCSRTRSIAALALLGEKELSDILQNEKKSEITCKFCNAIYQINEEELIALIKTL